MITRLRLIAAFCAALAAIPVVIAAQEGGAGAEQAVLQAERARFAALVGADAAALDTLMGADLTYVHSSGGIEDKTTFLAAVTSGRRKYAAFSGEDMHVRVVGNVALVNGLAKVTPTSNGKDGAPFTIRYTDVHVNRGGKWQLVAFQATRPPEKP